MEIVIKIQLPEGATVKVETDEASKVSEADVRAASTKPKRGAGRPKKEKEPAPSDETEEISEVGENDDGAEDFGEDFGDDDDADEVVSGEELTNLKRALKAFAEKNTKGKAIAILHKYANVSQDVKKSDLTALMKALKV